MKSQILVVLFSFSICFISFGNTRDEKIENQILNGQKKAALLEMRKLKASAYKNSLKRIIENKASYKDYKDFIFNVKINGEIQFQQLDNFISNRVNRPKDLEKINLYYVMIKWQQINNLRDELSILNATKTNNELRKYINLFNERDEDVQRAIVYLKTHQIVLNLIQGKIKEGSRFSLENIALATQLKDTFLILTSKYYYSEFLMEQGKLEDYIKNSKECLTIENLSTSKSYYYESTIEDLIDALIYKGNFDEAYIEKLLNSLYLNEEYRMNSFSLYAKYLGAIQENSAAKTRVFNRFGVNDLVEFCKVVCSLAKDKINSNDFYHLLNECSKSLLKNKDYNEAFSYKNKCVSLIKKIYSIEVAQSIANFQTEELQQQKKTEILKEKQKGYYYLIITIIILISLGISIILVYKLLKKSKDLESKNKEKELLNHELHHRVKNNFQLVIGFMRLQEKYADKTNLEDFIQASELKMNAMAMVHEMLYKEGNTEKIKIKEYINELSKSIINAFATTDTELTVNGDEIETVIDQAIPIGLVINELITNSIKHADKEELEIDITIENDDSFYILSVKDNGKGLPIDFNPEQSNSLGTKAILLLMNQINAQTSWKNDNGTQWSFKIPNL